MSNVVLDASAFLALLNQEPGSDEVAEAVASGATVSAVNLSEVVAKLVESGMPEDVVREALDPLGLEIVAFDSELAYSAGLLRPLTKDFGLSLGDRACLALARSLGLPAITADRTWAMLDVGVATRVIR